MANPYTYWKLRQQGESPKTILESPQCGFYRMKRGNKWVPVAVWPNKGSLAFKFGNEVIDERFGIECWPSYAVNDVSEEVWRNVVENGENWPDSDPIVTEMLTSDSLTKGENNKIDSITEYSEKILEALKGVGSYTQIDDDQTSTKAAGLRNLLLKLSNDADKARSVEKSPYLAEAKNVDAKWQPIVKQAKTGADVIRKALEEWESTKLLAASQASERANKAARDHADSIIKASQNGEDLPSLIAPTISPSNLPPPATQIKPTYGKAAAVRTYQSVVDIDIDKVFQASKDKPEVIEFFKNLAQKYAFTGILLDGVKVEERVKIR